MKQRKVWDKLCKMPPVWEIQTGLFFRKEKDIMKKIRSEIKSVTFHYTGTKEEFQKFLELLVRDYLRTDDPYTKIQQKSGDLVES